MKNELVEVATNVDGVKRSASFNYNFPESTQEAIGQLGEEATFKEFIYGYKVSVQGAARVKLSGLDASSEENHDYSPEVAQYMASWKLGDKVARGPRKTTDPLAALLAAFPTFSEEKQMEILRQFQAVGAGSNGSSLATEVPQEPTPANDGEEVSEESHTGRRASRK